MACNQLDHSRLDITLLVTAMNEIKSFPELVEWASDLDARKVLVDSGSTDGTDEFARIHGWEVIVHDYVNAARQLNWALDTVVDSDWVLILDADETPLFRPDEINTLVRRAIARGKCAVSFRRRNFFGDMWIRHGGFYPDRQVRLFRSHLRYECRAVHAHVQVGNRRILHADADLRHLTYTDIDDCWVKLVGFTRLEALVGMTASSRPRWRRLRTLYARVPAKAPMRFLYRYLLRGGFLDGRLGWHLAFWSAVYEDIVLARHRFESDRLESA